MKSSPGSKSGACTHGGLPRNLGDLIVSVRESREGPRLDSPGPGVARSLLPGANIERTHGTTARRKRSAAGGTVRSRSTPLYR